MLRRKEFKGDGGDDALVRIACYILKVQFLKYIPYTVEVNSISSTHVYS